jgi:hypothetical protein
MRSGGPKPNHWLHRATLTNSAPKIALPFIGHSSFLKNKEIGVLVRTATEADNLSGLVILGLFVISRFFGTTGKTDTQRTLGT